MTDTAKKSPFKKVAVVKVPNGVYKKDGVEKQRWHEIGILFATPHHSKMFIRFHATATGEGKTASIFYDEDQAPRGAIADVISGGAL